MKALDGRWEKVKVKMQQKGRRNHVKWFLIELLAHSISVLSLS